MQLEVFHGVLNDPDLVKNKCFFYLRDPPSKEDFSEDEYKVNIVCEFYIILDNNKCNASIFEVDKSNALNILRKFVV